MISNFFSKSKPIHFIVVSVILLLVFVLARLDSPQEGIDVVFVTKEIGLFLVCLLAVFVFDFFVTRNSLTKKNSYGIFLFVLFFAILPQTILEAQIIFANFFILLAMRRLISLRTNKDIKKKLFDASFWIAVASLCYFWSILFFALVLLALLVYTITGLKNYIIPFIGVATFMVILMSYLMIRDIAILEFLKNRFDMSFDFSLLNSRRIIVGSTILLSFGLWGLIYYIKNIRTKMKSYRPSFKLVVFAAVLGLGIVAVAPAKNGSEFIFLFAPLAIIMTNYLEVVSENWFKETLLWILVVTPVAILLL